MYLLRIFYHIARMFLLAVAAGMIIPHLLNSGSGFIVAFGFLAVLAVCLFAYAMGKDSAKKILLPNSIEE